MHDAVIIGAGPAGLTFAHEFASRTGGTPLVLEMSDMVGGISRTEEHHGNRIDIGGHRFFSRSDRVMSWWLDRLPLEKVDDPSIHLRYQGKSRDFDPTRDKWEDSHHGVDPHEVDRCMLVRERTSRIYWGGDLYDYPLSLNGETLSNLGMGRTIKAGLSYVRSTVAPVRDEETLEDYLINRFGRELYRSFFRDYTEKVWGVPCDEIPADWGAQRIKGLSITRALKHAIQDATSSDDLAQDGTPTSLIERFLYPKYGPGQLWEVVAEEVADLGGEVRFGQRVIGLEHEGDRITAVIAQDVATGQRERLEAEIVVSSMPLPHLVDAIGSAPQRVDEVVHGLPFRDFFTVGLLVDDLLLQPDEPERELIRDNWIYVQEPGVSIGRLQVFNNWSPWLVADPTKVWLGLEYFCNDTDDVWTWPDEDLIARGIAELEQIGVIAPGVARDATVLRVPKTYPAYFGTYKQLDEVEAWLKGFENLWCVGRNGQHRYNNQDHSMLTSMLAVDVLAGDAEPQDVDTWAVNAEDEYHEERDPGRDEERDAGRDEERDVVGAGTDS